MKKSILLLLAAILYIIVSPVVAEAELLEYDDSTSNVIAATHIISNGATGWNDPTIHAGDIFGFRYHIIIALKDTLQLRSLFDDHVLDSAKLSMVVSSIVGVPGALNFHMIRRDSAGTGVYPAYDDSRSYYCRSEWNGRKDALPVGCPNPIVWETPGGTGASDYNPSSFVTLSSPTAGQRHEIDVTPWIEGVVDAVDSVSNGILLLTANEDQAGVDYMSIRSIRPFFAGGDRLILRIWRSTLAGEARRAWIDSPDMLK